MLALSATACDFIIHLQNSLVMGKEALQRQLFTKFWQQIAQELDRYIFNMVCNAFQWLFEVEPETFQVRYICSQYWYYSYFS